MRRLILCFLVACGSSASGAGGPGAGTDAGTEDGAVAPGSEGGPDEGTDAPPPPDATVDGAAPPFAIHVKGATFVDGAGKAIRALGVNHSGSEYACAQGNGIFDSPHDEALAKAIAAWNVNIVRVPLNEDCWLGINGVKTELSGAAYQDAIRAWVTLLHAHGIYAILELHWSAPGTNLALRQQPMPDKDHAIDFWTSVASAYKSDPAVVFDLYNEPFVTTANAQTNDAWACWKSGCTITQPSSISGTYVAAGMQDLLDAVRAAGARNVVMAGGIAYSNDLSGWLTHRLSDPEAQLAASFHVYSFNVCNLQTCWDEQIAPVAAEVPLIAGEIGEDDCAHGFIDRYMTWADGRNLSYLGWTFNPWDCGTGPALVTDWLGTPTAFGAGLKTRLETAPK